MAKKKKRFKAHAVLEVTENRRLELMYSKGLTRCTIRAVVDNVPQLPYSKSDIFFDEEGEAYALIVVVEEEGQATATKLYLSNFKKVGIV